MDDSRFKNPAQLNVVACDLLYYPCNKVRGISKMGVCSGRSAKNAPALGSHGPRKSLLALL